MAEKEKRGLGTVLTDAFLDSGGQGGAYHPVLDVAIYHSKSDPSVVVHEEEHRRQFNNPGDYHSPTAKRIAKKYVPELLDRYSESRLPVEMPAFMAQANSNEAGTGEAQAPHPAWNMLDNEAKLWLLKNKDGWQTDQDFLDNIDKYGTRVARGIERTKHLGAVIADDLRQDGKSIYERAKAAVTSALRGVNLGL